MHRPSGTMLRAAVPLALAATTLTACGATTATHPSVRSSAERTTTAATREPANPTVPTLTQVPRQGAVGQPLTGRESRMRSVALQQVSEQALSAYQRAASVIDAADPSCRLSWTLLAALGQVESRAGAYGPVLDGRDGRAVVPDTDAGAVDQDPRFDRAVGPMQLLPSTWAQVAVDADGDGQRNPLDIDDAALGTAVFLCGNGDDLDTRPGKRAAVFRYNHSRPYVMLVLALSHQYAVQEQTLLPMTVAARAVSVAATGDLGPTSPTPTSGAVAGLVTKPRPPTVAPAGATPTGPTPTGPTPTDPTPTGPSPTGPTPTTTPPPAPDPTPTPSPTPDPTPDPTPVPSPTPDPSPSAPATSTAPTDPPTGTP